MPFQNILRLYRIQRVSKFVGNTRIDHIKKLILCSLLVEHDGIGDVDYLDYCFTFEFATFDLDVSILSLA